MQRVLEFLRIEWRFSILAGAILLLFVHQYILSRRVRKVLDNRAWWQRQRDRFRRLFGG